MDIHPRGSTEALFRILSGDVRGTTVRQALDDLVTNELVHLTRMYPSTESEKSPLSDGDVLESLYHAVVIRLSDQEMAAIVKVAMLEGLSVEDQVMAFIREGVRWYAHPPIVVTRPEVE